jgi:hypothetical protein
MFTDDSIVVIAPDQVACDLQGELLILNTASGVYYGLDPVGKRIWSLLREPHRVSAIRDVLLEEYNVDRERCDRDLQALLKDLVRNGLVEVKVEATA